MTEERKNEIVREYESLIEESGDLVEKLNDNWQKKMTLRKEYETLTGNDISKRHEVK